LRDRERFLGGDIDELSFATGFRVQQREERSLRSVDARRDVRLVAVDGVRRVGGFSRERHDTAHRLANDVGVGVPRVRTALSEASHRGVDQRRLFRMKLFVAEAARRKPARRVVFEHHLCGKR